DRSFQLERGDAEEVAEALAEILGLESDEKAGSSSRSPSANNPPSGARTATNNALPGNQNAGGAPPASVGTTYSAGGGKPAAVAGKPIIRAITRTNRLLVVARPVDMTYIERLVEHLDSPQEISETFTRKLNHLKPTAFLDIASDALTRGLDDGTSGSSSGLSGSGSNSNRFNQSNSFNNNGFDSSSRVGGGFGSDSSGFGTGGGFGSGGIGGSSRSGGGGFSGGTNMQLVPVSHVIGKTLLIADDVNSSLMVSGPSEQIDLIDKLLETLDVKPRQIQISAIIAQLGLGDDFEYGMDLLRTLETVGPDGRMYNAAGLLKTRNGTNQTLGDINDLDTVANFPIAQGLSLYGQVNPYLDVFLSALASTNRFEVLSRPTIYT
ncbi:MAG: hypothetical protein KDM63_21440, partial [Verrucomicrobiae bacterium]|nr:hypothetical protein [Verrucomicrobiae bacterium]